MTSPIRFIHATSLTNEKMNQGINTIHLHWDKLFEETTRKERKLENKKKKYAKRFNIQRDLARRGIKTKHYAK